MKPKIAIVTLGVADLQRSLHFYRDGLGFPAPDYHDGAGIIFFQLEGTWLAVYPREQLQQEADVHWSTNGAPTITLAHNVESRDAVDAALNQAQSAGATIAKHAHDTFWGGYSGYFADPDGYLWEVAWNPFTDLT